MSAHPEASAARHIDLQQVLDLRAAAPLAEELRAHRGADVEIDASAVDRLGAQCAQVLLSASKSWGEDGRLFSIISPSEAFARSVDLFGVELPVVSRGDA